MDYNDVAQELQWLLVNMKDENVLEWTESVSVLNVT
jgi:hypothetical protein